jgi:hypothetical protein
MCFLRNWRTWWSRTMRARVSAPVTYCPHQQDSQAQWRVSVVLAGVQQQTWRHTTQYTYTILTYLYLYLYLYLYFHLYLYFVLYH